MCAVHIHTEKNIFGQESYLEDCCVWKLISLLYPSIEKSELVLADENASYAFFFLSMRLLFSNSYGSTSVMAAYT